MVHPATYTVTVGGETFVYPAGTTLRAIASDFQCRYPHDIVLANRSGKLCELHKTLDRDCTLEFFTTLDRVGMRAYERSALFLLLKAFHDVADRSLRINVEYSLSHALFLRIKNLEKPDPALLARTQQRMEELSAMAVPLVKRSVSTDDAIAMFRQVGMEEKARLFQFRISSYVNLYYLENYFDYFYGFMVPDAGYLRCFRLEAYADGFILRLPDYADPTRLADFHPSYKVYQALAGGENRAQALQVTNVGELNAAVSVGKAGQIILAQEALMEKQIGDIAEQIASRRDIRFVMIAGPSSSGKTTFSHRLSTQLMACGLRPHPIAADNYFKNREDTPRDQNGEYDFECLGAMDLELFNRDMTQLLQGKTVDLPTFNFKKGIREYNGNTMTLGPQDVLIIEGIHCLNEQFSFALPQESKFRIYISCLTTLNIDDHNRIPTTDARLLRRIARDARTRGFSPQATIKRWPSVRRGEENNIFPYQDSADVVFNSALIYETALLRPYVEPLLFHVPRGCPEYGEAMRLLKFLSYFLTIPADNVPQSSLIREFIGGSCY